MRQVPQYLVIGSGRMATHFCHYLTLLNLPYHQWARRHQPLEELPALIDKASHIILLINDGSISSFIERWSHYQDKIFVHFSGRLSLKNAYSAHPLMTFTQTLYDKEIYSSIPFIIEENSPPLLNLLPGIPNLSFAIPSKLKAYYHALCVISNNFTCLLWNKFFNELQTTFNLPASIAFPILMQTFNNLKNNPNASLTGPLVRQDYDTIFSHLEALENDKFLTIYQAFLNVYQS